MALLDAIKALHTSMIDTKDAYKKARAETEADPVLEALFDEMVALRYKHHEQLHRVLTAMGEEPDESGSIMSSVNRTVVAVRSAVKGIDRDALSAFANGEDTILREYDDALHESDLRPETSDLLTRQKNALVGKVEQMRALGNAPGPA